MKHLYIIILLFASLKFSYSQQVSNFRTKQIAPETDSVQVDSLSIVPHSLIMYDQDGFIVPDSLYSVDLSTSVLLLKPEVCEKNNNIRISYRVFPYNFSEKYFHKNYDQFRADSSLSFFYYTYVPEKKEYNTLIYSDKLDKRGSISRGVTFGNNQDAVVNSDLNLQLSGKLSDDLNIVAVISDNNIPIQPEGNTQQLQEFDKVFIQVYNDNTNLTVGDFEIERPTGYFMNLYKKVQGATISTRILPGKKEKDILKAGFSGAVSKGKYSRNVFNGTEGNQGPYKLIGQEGETYIIVLAGTEKVYIDGKLMKRGQENDYIINYNTAEISFTPNQLITKDKRIVVEFEYSDKNYARFLLYSTNEYQCTLGSFWVNAFLEQDSKNQPLSQSLTNEQKKTLANAGDSLQYAFTLNADSIPFDNGLVLYKKTDTIVNGLTYTNIYVYSSNPDSAFFRVGFSYAGKNNGDYILVQSAANGKVFHWVSPENGVRSGDYNPVKLLVAPRKKQLVTLGANANLFPVTKYFFEIAMSNNDVNTFSDKNNDENIGYALKIGLEQKVLMGDTGINNLTVSADYQLVDDHFEPIERFRSIEFDRDWNMVRNPGKETEHLVGVNINYTNARHGNAVIYTEYFYRKNGYKAIRNSFSSLLQEKKWELGLNGSLLNSNDHLNKTVFIRHTASLSKKLPFAVVGIKENVENNQWKDKATDSLLNNSFMFSQYEAFITNPDTSVNRFMVAYKNRKDFLPGKNRLKYSSMGEDLTMGAHFLKNRDNILRVTFTYRMLEIKDSLLSDNLSENTILTRVEHSSRLFKKAVSTSTFYEIGSGLELKKEFSYLEVAQGQGSYSWTDYNNNSIKELNEFELANFQDEANYIRIYTPTNDYIKVYTNQFNQTINFKPGMVWKKSKGVKKFIANFSDVFAYRMERKISEKNFWLNANPLASKIADTSLVSTNTSVRNILSFERATYGADYIFQQSQSRSLLVNGFDARKMLLNGIRNTWHIYDPIRVINYFTWSNKDYDSQYFEGNNYKIASISNEFSLVYQPGFNLEISGSYQYSEKSNELSIERSYQHNWGAELKYTLVNKGALSAKVHYIRLHYTSQSNTPIAYQMLEGLMPGDNATWETSFIRSLGKGMEMNFNYSGRVSGGSKAIHTGNIQVRAIF